MESKNRKKRSRKMKRTWGEGAKTGENEGGGEGKGGGRDLEGIGKRRNVYSKAKGITCVPVSNIFGTLKNIGKLNMKMNENFQYGYSGVQIW